MEYHALVIRDGHMALLDPPAIICRSWHPTEDPDLDGDEEELAIEVDLHARGWRMCQCYSRSEPDGEFGHIAEGRLLAIPQLDFEEALWPAASRRPAGLRGACFQRGCEGGCRRIAYSMTLGWGSAGLIGDADRRAVGRLDDDQASFSLECA